ncbi:MAG: hypothetical protein HGB12_06510 [Bacteroidetes bacterium]|nr:hypothetical protein [Bacteroidota bacterium]
MNKSDNYFKFISYRKQFKRFVFESFNVNRTAINIEISYNFNLDDKYFFRPLISIPLKPFIKQDELSVEKLSNIAFNIGMVELISYWKAACPKEIIIKPFFLNEEQKKWWKNLYYNGLGEFFYLNSIQTSIDDFVEIISLSEDLPVKVSFNAESSVIIPVGGGKDSAVTIELLSEYSKDNLLLIMNPREACIQTASIAGYTDEKIIVVKRSIDPVLLKMNDEGFLNGHTPFSALLAFISLFCAYITGKKHIALSNESSANEATVENTSVNHQYSKSYEFEKDFRSYYMKYITEDVNYFSFLRPINELQIAKIFSKSNQYFTTFKSCNSGSKTDSWCGVCPKCLFTYIILSPFIKKDKLEEIFGKNLFNDKNLLEIFDQLIGISDTKPFECVGTIDEVNGALCLHLKNEKDRLPYLLEHYINSKSYLKYKDIDITLLLNEYNNEHFLEKSFEKILKKNLND